MLECELTLNGVARPVRVDGSTTLLQVLREQLHLTGAKRGCDYGVCGACTVLLDGEAVRACLTLAADVEGRAVTTIEGLAEPGAMTPLQQVLVEAGAVQCGFCTPGIVLALHALLERGGAVDEEAVRAALDGNICRCSGYAAIVEATLKVAHG